MSERNGRYRARVTIHRRTYQETYRTQGEAWAWINSLLECVEDAPQEAPKTLQSVSDEWFADRERSGIRHVAKERSCWRTHVQSWDRAYRPIEQLRRVHIRDHILELATRGGLKPATVRKPLSLIRGCLSYAHDGGLIDANPAVGLRAPRGSLDVDAWWTWLEPSEIDALMSLPLKPTRAERRAAKAAGVRLPKPPPNAITVRERAILAVAIFVGLRKSEIWHLRWSTVKLDGPRPEVRVRGPLKSPSALRSVPLLPPALSALRAWKAAAGADAPDVRRIDPYVFPSETGGRHHATYTSTWRDKRYKDRRGRMRVTLGIRSKAGIDRRVRFQDLRHTCASHLVQGTWTPQPMDLYRTKQWMGHSDIETTQRYAHLDPGGLHTIVRGAEASEGLEI